MDQQAQHRGEGSFLASRQGNAVAPGTPCYNCGTPLVGPWCHACGQAATDFHRHAHHLIGETIESLFHADGRLWRTVPRLVRDPAGLTRDYLAGKRASQIPPMRLVLVTLVIVFLAGGADRALKIDVRMPSAADQAELRQAKDQIGVEFGSMSAAWNKAATAWVREHVGRAIAQPERLTEGMHAWAHDFAFLMLPISALLLALIFIGRPGFVLFDHFIFSMHSLSFQGLLISIVLVLPSAVPGGWLLLASPLHLFVHMRGVYGTSAGGTLVRMGVLFVASAVAFGLLLAALVVVGLMGLRA